MAKVLGIERVQYVSKKGTDVDGWKLYLGEENENVIGNRTYDVYFTNNETIGPICECLHLEDEVEILYNRFKKPIMVTIV